MRRAKAREKEWHEKGKRKPERHKDRSPIQTGGKDRDRGTHHISSEGAGNLRLARTPARLRAQRPQGERERERARNERDNMARGSKETDRQKARLESETDTQ